MMQKYRNKYTSNKYTNDNIFIHTKKYTNIKILTGAVEFKKKYMLESRLAVCLFCSQSMLFVCWCIPILQLSPPIVHINFIFSTCTSPRKQAKAASLLFSSMLVLFCRRFCNNLLWGRYRALVNLNQNHWPKENNKNVSQ